MSVCSTGWNPTSGYRQFADDLDTVAVTLIESDDELVEHESALGETGREVADEGAVDLGGGRLVIVTLAVAVALGQLPVLLAPNRRSDDTI